jgi:hypothetical protein
MTSRRLGVAFAAFAALFLLSLPLTARVPGSDFQVRHVVWVALSGLALKSCLAWTASRRGD